MQTENKFDASFKFCVWFFGLVLKGRVAQQPTYPDAQRMDWSTWALHAKGWPRPLSLFVDASTDRYWITWKQRKDAFWTCHQASKRLLLWVEGTYGNSWSLIWTCNAMDASTNAVGGLLYYHKPWFIPYLASWNWIVYWIFPQCLIKVSAKKNSNFNEVI